MRDRIESAVVFCARVLLNVAYRFCTLFPRKNEAVFVSRQANDPSYDFKAIGKALEGYGYSTVFLTQKLSKRTVLRYLSHSLREIYHLACCKICFVDRYDPVICLVDFKCERFDAEEKGFSEGIYTSFPLEPVIVQIWHAFGAFKKFGFQSRDTLEGHSSTTMSKYRIHRNYSWVLCSGTGCRVAFSQAFNCPVERVIPLLRPEYDELKRLKNTLESKMTADKSQAVKKSVLFAPTLRKSSDSEHPFHDLYRSEGWKALEKNASTAWAFHPLEQTGMASGTVSDALLLASVVITDYSSIAYEAYLLNKPVIFFVPDIEKYRISPGLNADPMQICQEISFTEEHAMLSFVEALLKDEKEYPWQALRRFAGAMIDEADGCAVDRLAEQALLWVKRGGR